jgi:transposase
MKNNREHRHLSEIQVVKLVTLFKEVHSHEEVARRLCVSQSVGSRAWGRYRETVSTIDNKDRVEKACQHMQKTVY